VRALLELGARVNVENPEHVSLAEIARNSGKEEIARLLDAFTYDARSPFADTFDESNRDALVARFLANACPDHHVRGGQAHIVARGVAESILARHPDIARENIYTAVVCGEIDLVRGMLAADPDAARRRGGPKGSADGQSERFVLSATSAAHPRWEPLLYLCYARLDHAPTNDNAIALAELLLDHGADPNAYFM